jgi:hypothetical protein
MSSPIQPDDPSLDLPIPDDLVLWRRVPPDKKVFDHNLSRWRPSSDAFCDHKDGSSMSVYDSQSCGGKEAVMVGHDGFLLCSFTAGDARSRNMTIVRTTRGGPGHCEVVGKKTDSVKNKFAKNARWVIAPNG